MAMTTKLASSTELLDTAMEVALAMTRARELVRVD
eukprot:CAMPEP_0206424244 /NCGR_PEP_ID=MMETSP0324_2-20121206/3123_1 /ASSEMBLY_ACC=CAM_ASM_000836 /TAXON_ID=2866 /ORGANISM="Crypthecodinium cohnii, Strain Seligo" /LENGTH=34 /DNA_ID= /DNA_START= /DNA_END= /DNA_ORIENTATION=